MKKATTSKTTTQKLAAVIKEATQELKKMQAHLMKMISAEKTNKVAVKTKPASKAKKATDKKSVAKKPKAKKAEKKK